MNKLLKKKFLIVGPSFYEWDLGTYLKKLLQSKNIDCRIFAYWNFKTKEEANRQLLRTAGIYKPDIILGLKMDGIKAGTLKTLKKANIFLVLWYIDCFTQGIPKWIKPLFREVDVFLTTAKGMIPKYQTLDSIPTYWIYEGVYLPSFPSTRLSSHLKKIYGSQIAFIGNIFQPPVADEKIALRRFRLFEKINKKYQLKAWGPQVRHLYGKRRNCLGYSVTEWPAYNEELVKICQAADIVLGINTVNTIELYFSNRTFLTLASGGFHLTHYVPGLETMFDNHKHLVWFKSDEECLDLIAYYLKHPHLRQKISQRGRRLVRKKYSMKRQLNRILNLITIHYDKR